MNSPSDGGLEQLQSGMVPAFTVLTDSPEAALIVLSGMGDKWPPGPRPWETSFPSRANGVACLQLLLICLLLSYLFNCAEDT